MNSEQIAKEVRKLYSVISGKSDTDLVITYKGNSYGVKYPWNARIDTREVNAISFEASLETLRDYLRVELKKKADDLARDAQNLQTLLNNLDN